MKNLFYCGIKVILRSLSNDQATMASTVTSSQLLLGSETLRCLHECFELQKSCLVFHMVIRIYSNSRITSVSASESFISDSPPPPPSPTCRNYRPLLSLPPSFVSEAPSGTANFTYSKVFLNMFYF